MWCYDHILCREKRIVRRHRLLCYDIHRGSSYTFLVQGICQILLHYATASGSVYDECSLLHPAYRTPVYHSLRLREQRTVYAYHIRLCEQFIPLSPAYPIAIRQGFPRPAVHQHPHAKCMCDLSHLHTYTAIAYDTHSLARKLHGRHRTVGEILTSHPATVLH